ncbi:hypothetical protein WJX72_005751 [[Myrmecia] bisecta]|uniref:HIT domain-containing protein n=1 Tax=[Myrmecia] bisecta TaxID=41462 RepID=A0AAW1Q2P5_9CHLO
MGMWTVYLWAAAVIGMKFRKKRAITEFLKSGAKADFELWSSLKEGKIEVVNWPLCKVLLVDDANFPCWLVLVPQQNGLRELTDLSKADSDLLWGEILRACRAVQELCHPKKLNVATLGNVCKQLHIHITARNCEDPAWPGPCYGAVEPKPLDKEHLQLLVSQLDRLL